MLIFSFKKEWYEKIRSGEKTVEYREVNNYWTSRLWHNHCLPNLDPFAWNCTKDWSAEPVPCILSLGYTKRKMTADIIKVELFDGKNSDLCVDKPVYAIHLTNVRDIK